jgi:hypothetical protein
LPLSTDLASLGLDIVGRVEASALDADGERNSLMLAYYVQNGAVDRLAERARRLWVFFAYAMRR